MADKRMRLKLVAALVAAISLSACNDKPNPNASNTAVLGGSAPPQASGPIPPPPVPRTAHAEVAWIGDHEALAVWEHNGNIVAARYLPVAGWQPAETLEDIGGQSSMPRVGANLNGVAMAVWQHTVGRVESLRYSRYVDGKGWSTPDVMPGARPQPRKPGKSVGASVTDAAPKIEVDPAGHVRAQWRSGFNDQEWQVSTYVANEGWSRPLDIPIASAN